MKDSQLLRKALNPGPLAYRVGDWSMSVDVGKSVMLAVHVSQDRSYIVVNVAILGGNGVGNSSLNVIFEA